MTYKCVKCGYEWNARGAQAPKQCAAHCGSREVILLTSAVNKPDVNKESVNKSGDVNKSGARLIDSVAAPGLYLVCATHRRRYCQPCGTAQATHGPFSPQQWTDAHATIERQRRHNAKT